MDDEHENGKSNQVYLTQPPSHRPQTVKPHQFFLLQSTLTSITHKLSCINIKQRNRLLKKVSLHFLCIITISSKRFTSAFEIPFCFLEQKSFVLIQKWWGCVSSVSPMANSHLFLLLLQVSVLALFHGVQFASAEGTDDGSQQWGYVQVRPKAHMFWWHYKSPYRVEDPNKPWPIILWLQGGPGASGVGIGNFQEVGPLDTGLKARNSTWLRKADLLFVDNPVGTGYSYVEDEKAYVKTDEEAATDLTTLLKEIFNNNKILQKSPLYIVAESYGGKYAVTLGLSAFKAIEAGELKLKLGGVALGDSWISPEDFVFSWGPLLKDVSRLDINGLSKSNSLALTIHKQLEDGQYEDATNTWSDLEQVISDNSNSVDFYNFLLDSGSDPVSMTAIELSKAIALRRYSRYLDAFKASPGGSDDDLDGLMNGAIKKSLKIIPENVTWGGQSGHVFSALAGDFMKPRINEVDELLAKGVNVTVYNGQLDLICATKGTEAWVEKLKWEGLKTFLGMNRTPLYCGHETGTTRGFRKSYKNLHFYWILEAGHFVPVDQPCLALQMVGDITQSPGPSL